MQITVKDKNKHITYDINTVSTNIKLTSSTVHERWNQTLFDANGVTRAKSEILAYQCTKMPRRPIIQVSVNKVYRCVKVSYCIYSTVRLYHHLDE